MNGQSVYEFWQMLGSGEIWAVEIKANGDIGLVNGPLHYRDIEEADAETIVANGSYEDTDWVTEHQGDFRLREDELRKIAHL